MPKAIHGITVAHFFETYGVRLKLELVTGREGLHRLIREPAINRPALALTGFFKYFANKRIQVLGAAAMTFLRTLPEGAQRSVLNGGAHIQLDVGHFDPENLVVIFLESGALLHRVRRPRPQAHDHVDAFFEPDALDAEHLGNVDDADAAALHVAPRDRPAAGHQLAFIEQLDDRDIVGDQTVAAFDQGERALG